MRFLTALCNDIDPLDLGLRRVVLDGVHSVHRRVFRVSIYVPTRLWANFTARRCRASFLASVREGYEVVVLTDTVHASVVIRNV
jgi:hypothetical protein